MSRRILLGGAVMAAMLLGASLAANAETVNYQRGTADRRSNEMVKAGTLDLKIPASAMSSTKQASTKGVSLVTAIVSKTNSSGSGTGSGSGSGSGSGTGTGSASKGHKPIPEPATLILLGTGITGIAASVRKRRRNSKE